MNFMKKLMCVFFCFSSMILWGQRYYGKNDFGMIDLSNDSSVIVSFIGSFGIDHIINLKEKGIVRKAKDTLFLSTVERWEYKVSVDSVMNFKRNHCVPTLYRIYHYNSQTREYDFDREGIAWRDTIIGKVNIWCEDMWPGYYLLMIKVYNQYERIVLKNIDYFENNGMLITISRNPNFKGHLVFDDFPLLIKGNKLVPISKNKCFQCWIENGFVFPKMKKKNQFMPYYTYYGYNKSLTLPILKIPKKLKPKSNQ